MKRTAVAKATCFLLLVAGWLVALALWLQIISPSPVEFHNKTVRYDPAPPPAPAEMPSLATAFDREKQALPAVALAFVLLDERGDTLYASPLADTAMCPASALKTLTTAAALEILGPEFQFGTRLAASSSITANGTLDGDLVLISGGDPTLSFKDLENLSNQVTTSGLKKITGSIRVDTSVFPNNPVNDHWNWGDIGNAYGAGAFGLNVNHNRMLIRFSSGNSEGESTKITSSEPVLPDAVWRNHVTTGPAGSGDGVMVYSSPYSNTITARGTVPIGEPGFPIRAAIPDPPALALDFLIKHVGKSGVVIEGRASSNKAASETLATHMSAPLPEIIDHLHRVSDNLEAQCLFLILGHQRKADPAAVIQNHFENAGVAFEGLRLLDGSGLARANMIRPIDLARANHAASKGPHGERFLQSLNTHPSGFRSKNGAMSGVRTEVGFLTMADGRQATFALMANGLTGDGDFRAIRDRLLDAARTR